MTEIEPHATETRENFKYFHAIELRWNDLDAYRHVNNARFYTFYDTTIMRYLITRSWRRREIDSP